MWTFLEGFDGLKIKEQKVKMLQQLCQVLGVLFPIFCYVMNVDNSLSAYSKYEAVEVKL